MNAPLTGGCLCAATTYRVSGGAINPHLCSCVMCQKSSGAPTVAWVEFPLAQFEWTGDEPNAYASSDKTLRLSCKTCGGLLGTLNEGFPNICLTIATLDMPGDIIPTQGKHSFESSAPTWWQCSIEG